MGGSSGRLFTFSVFTFDPETGELLRNGRKLKVSDQNARLLAVLVENAGTMVTREELRAVLWPQGEILDYDHSINRAVSQLRAILRDRSSKGALFIDTLPKRGYRFVAETTVIDKTVPPNLSTAPAQLNERIDSCSPDLAISALPPAQTLALSTNPTVVLETKAGRRNILRISLLTEKRHRLILGFCIALLFLVSAWFLYAHRGQHTEPLSIGIVPFEASGNGAETIAESFRLDLADALSQIPTVDIKAAHSFDHSGQDEAQLRARAMSLHVQALLFGKFHLDGTHCQLQLELVRSRDGVHINSFHYEGTKEELAAMRDRIQNDIFIHLFPSEHSSAITLSKASSPTAYEAYLRGRYFLSQWTDDSLKKAVSAFQESLSYDPGYARSYAGLASTYFVLEQHGASPREESVRLARMYATKALSLDRSLAEAYAILGQISLNTDWNFVLAEEQLLRATQLDPYHAVYHLWLAVLYGEEGKYDLALRQIDDAHAADPEWAPVYMTEVFVAGSARQTQRSRHAAETLVHLMPDWPLAHEQNALDLWNSRRFAEAIEEWKLAATLEKNADRVNLEEQGAEAFRKGGVTAYARLRLQAIATHKGTSHEDADFIPAEWHAYAGEWDEAIACLDQMVSRHSQEALQITANPAYFPLHNDSRFQQIVRRIGIPHAA